MTRKPKGALGQAAATLGKKGGKSGGPARAKVLTAAERTAIASKGGKARSRQKQRGGG
jgi:hypothetical protein